jgi:two-component system response regulator LytT
LLVNPLDRDFKERFTVKIGQHLKIIPIEDIECFYSENKGTYIFTSDKREYLIDMTLEQLDPTLNPTKFFRVSRKFFVNINQIKDIISYTNSRLKIILNNFSEHEIIVSREKVKDFKNWIG